MKTTTRSYFIKTSRIFIFRSQNYFRFHLHPKLSWWRDDNVIWTNFKLKLEMKLKNICETGKPNLTKLVMTNLQLVVFIKHDPGELRGLYLSRFPWRFKVGPSLNSDPLCITNCYYTVRGRLEIDDGRLVSALARRDQERLSWDFGIFECFIEAPRRAEKHLFLVYPSCIGEWTSERASA